jgi:hypothetical protein
MEAESAASADVASSADSVSLHHFRNDSDEGNSTSHAEVTDIEVHLLESNSYRDSVFNMLGGAMDSILIMNILTYLDACDLSVLSKTNKFFARSSLSPILWDSLFRNDFIVDAGVYQSEGLRRDSPRPSLHSYLTIQSSVIDRAHLHSKASYIRRHHEYSQRVLRAKEWDIEAQIEATHSARVRTLEDILDFTQVRVMIPLILACIILTTILFCQKIDGLDISYWMCFIPLLVSLLYVMLSFRLLLLVHKHQYSTKELLRGMWANFRGPAVFVFQEILGSQQRLLYATLVFLFVCILQVLLVAAKLSSSTPPSFRDHYLPWGVVFIPIWLCLLAYCAMPSFVQNLEPGVFMSFLCLFIAPVMIFFICLAVKLTGEQHHTKARKIRLALMLIPFWILEALTLLGTLLFFFVGVIR